ncbi:MAG: hypothetical protein QGG40_06955 [Myxococcota bacterium]|jgi:hypothetical protein|nr:hypothetical protein [Myxococcota bacterium]
METMLTVIVLFGLSCVSLCFFILMPTVGQLTSCLWGAVFLEKTVAKIRGVPSGTETPESTAS